jgi:hypothetical protein
MSDIPRARGLLHTGALAAKSLAECKSYVVDALEHMTRKRPAFRVEHDAEPMTDYKRQRARNLRRKGLSLRAIALALNTNIGRVSEAINGKRNGI